MLQTTEDLHALPEHYHRLFTMISRYRPEIIRDLQRLRCEVSGWRWNIDEDCENGLRQTYSVFDRLLQWQDRLGALRQIDGDGIGELLALYSLYVTAQAYGNYWQVLLDGVIFEGVMEAEAGRLLTELSKRVEVPVVELMFDVVEPQTGYQYLPVAAERKARSDALIASLSERLGPSGREFMDTFHRFIHIYSQSKCWNLVFKKCHAKRLDIVFPAYHNRLAAACTQLGFPVSGDTWLPWNLLPHIEQTILPQLFRNRAPSMSELARILNVDSPWPSLPSSLKAQ